MCRLRILPVLIAVAILSCVLFAACRISDGGIPRPYTRSIGPNGGTIADPAGATLIIPAGALAENTRITVTTYQDTLDFGTAFPVLAGALFGVKLEPEGLEFAAPVTLQIAPTATLTAGNEYPAFWYDATADQWVQTGHATVDAGGAYVETTITHFSDYSIFDMPYDVLDDFDEYVAEHPVPDYSPTEWGELYIQCELFENESFVGPDQYYNGCCYMRNGADVQIDWTYEGVPHTYGDRFGSSSDDSYTLSYSFSSGTLTYSIVLTVYLSCSQGETNVWISSVYDTLEVGERSEVYGTYLCGEAQTPIAGRIFTFSLSGPGRLSRTTAVTDEEGEARIEYIATQNGTAVITATMEGCLCNAQLDLNPLVTTITVGGGQSYHVAIDAECTGLTSNSGLGFTTSLDSYLAHFEFDIATTGNTYDFGEAGEAPPPVIEASQMFGTLLVANTNSCGGEVLRNVNAPASFSPASFGTVLDGGGGNPQLMISIWESRPAGGLSIFTYDVDYTWGNSCEVSDTFSAGGTLYGFSIIGFSDNIIDLIDGNTRSGTATLKVGGFSTDNCAYTISVSANH